VESGQSIAAQRRSLGVVDQTLFNWVKGASRGEAERCQGQAQLKCEQMEISRLRAGWRRVTMERDILGKSDGVLSQRARNELRLYSTTSSGLADPCAVPVLRVSDLATINMWGDAGRSAPRHLSDEALLVHLRAVFAREPRSLGWPRSGGSCGAGAFVWAKQRGQRRCSSMASGPAASGASASGPPTAGTSCRLPPTACSQLRVAAPKPAWTGDITYIPTEEGWLFLAVVIDLFSAGWWAGRCSLTCGAIW